MKIAYDSEVDAMYISFLDHIPQVITHQLTEEVAINYAPDGRIAGIEVLDASEYIFSPNAARQVEIHNLTPVAA